MYNDRRIVYSHAKFRFEIEIPEEHVKTEKPREFDLTSHRIGYQRFSTHKTRELVDRLEAAEEA